jgi:proteasome alpha subunit
MMLEEPYRWADAVGNRREYIEDQLRSGSPVVGSAYAGGALLLTLGQGQQKLFEVYDRIAMGALGHPTDIEKLRQAAVDLAHVIGFNYSDADVTLQQVVHFGLGPEVKRAFDEIFRSPYIAQLLLAEVSPRDRDVAFFRVDYEGRFHRKTGTCAAGGNEAADRAMQARLDGDGKDTGALSLEEALDRLLLAWAAGRRASGRDEDVDAPDEQEESNSDEELSATLSKALETLSVEAVAVEVSDSGTVRYRTLSDEETATAAQAYRADDEG